MRKPQLVQEHEAAGRYLDIDGQRIFVREEGGGPAVLLLHGVPSSSFLYRKMLPALAAQGLRAITFDFPGIGLSDKPPDAAYDWHTLATWVGKVVDALGIERVHLVVHDIAGPIGAEWAIEHQDRIASLTIMNTLLDVANFKPPFPMWTFRVPGLRHITFGTQTPSVNLALFRQSGVKDRESIDREVMAAYIYLLKCNGGHKTFLDVMAGFDLTEPFGDRLREGLQGLKAPLQMVWGKHEVAIPKAQFDYVRDTFPVQAVHEVDARHFLQEDQAQACSTHIANFVGGLN